MYKDPDKQREAQRNWVRQKRAEQSPDEHKVRTEGTFTGSTEQGSTEPKGSTNEAQTSPVVDEVEAVDSKVPPATITTEQAAKMLDSIDDRVALVIPDYPVPVIPKRGKDIKCFADLPPDVQATINRISESAEEKDKRTKIAIQYQHLFPDRYHSTGI